MKILIVDDVAVIRAVIRDILMQYCKTKPEDIFEATNGNGAIQKYPKIRPDAVFLDINMPGMDGINTIKEIMKFDRYAKIIMCTSSGERTDVVDCLNAGAVAYILKPPSPEKIKEVLSEALDIDFDEVEEEEEEIDANTEEDNTKE